MARAGEGSPRVYGEASGRGAESLGSRASYCLIVLLSYPRIFFGLDFTDEAFYVAMPLAVARGAEPFSVELALQQTASLLAVPLVKTYLWIVPDASGVVLFIRHLYFALCLGVSLLFFEIARREVGEMAATFVATAILLFSPVGIPSLSYNTLGQLFFLLGIGGLLVSDSAKHVGAIGMGSGLALALAAFSYPTLAVPGAGLVVFATRRVFARDSEGTDRRRIMLSPASGFLIGAAVAGAFLLSVGVDRLRASLDYMSRFGIRAPIGTKASWLMAELWDCMRGKPVFLGIFGTACVLSLLRVRCAGRAVLLLSASYWAMELWNFRPGHNHFFFTGLSLLAIPIAWLERVLPSARRIVSYLLIPSLAMGAVFAFTSSNGLPNAAYGSLGAYLAFVLLIVLALDRRGVWGSNARRTGALAILLGLHTLAFFRVYYGTIYRDDSLSSLKVQIRHGPYAGLYTSESKREFLAELQRDLDALTAGVKSAVFYDEFPAGYLLSSLRPASPALWINAPEFYPRFDRAWFTRYYDEPGNRPDIAVEFHEIPVTSSEVYDFSKRSGDPLRGLFGRLGYRLVVEKRAYRIWLAK